VLSAEAHERALQRFLPLFMRQLLRLRVLMVRSPGQLQQVGPQHAFASGFRALMNALANFPSTAGAKRSTSTPLSVRNARASSIL
jgi:hypothetical protein